jgi:hypothetical protein
MFRFALPLFIATLFTVTAAAQDAGTRPRHTAPPASPFQLLTESGLDDNHPNAPSDGIGTAFSSGTAATGQGYGSGAGPGLRGRGTAGPTIVAPPPATDSLLAPEAIRHTILSHMTQVDGCFARARRDTPTLHGRLVAHFTIRGDGSVSNASIIEAEVPSDHMNACLLRAIGGWHFPQPAGQGIVIVNYPFNLVDDHPSPPPRAPAPPRRGHQTPTPPPAPAAPAAPTLSPTARAT